MTNISLPREDDFKRWVREVIREELHQAALAAGKSAPEEGLLSRQQIAAELGISLEQTLGLSRMRSRIMLVW